MIHHFALIDQGKPCERLALSAIDDYYYFCYNYSHSFSINTSREGCSLKFRRLDLMLNY